MQNLSAQSGSHFFQQRRLETHQPQQADLLYYAAKRVIDVGVTILALLLLWPLLLLIAALIKVESPGPVFFVQQRVGARRRVYNGETVWEIQPFPMVKFRSMAHNADQSLHEEHIKAYVSGLLDDGNDGSAKFKLTDDPRITRVGRFLRKTSLDEAPQMINVLRGEMSLVGPRPVPLYEAALYQPEHYERLMAVPGLTGLWQVEGRGEVTFEEMMRLDIRYVRHRSFLLDFLILVQTIPVVLRGRGAA
ncbi:MAG: sugar transferase [Caldilineaceae bacterium]|nr:sugar transferase [Caldilineaceae bacterium]